VKIRGFRIEIGEIENALLRVLGVRDGAAVVAERADRSKYLVAFYSCQRSLAVDVLRDRLGESLPEYMVPSAFHWQESLPLYVNRHPILAELAELVDGRSERRSGLPRSPSEPDDAPAGARPTEAAQAVPCAAEVSAAS